MPVLARAAACAALLITAIAHAQDGQGFAELRLSLYPGAGGDAVQVVERVRPTFEVSLGEEVKLAATVEAALAQGRDLAAEVEAIVGDAGLAPLLEAAGCSFPEYENPTLRIDDAGDYLDVDRLFLDAYFGEVDLRLGRQALTWGSGMFFNPTDPFPEVLFAQPWRPRRGVNAARATVPFGERNDLTVVAAVNDALDEGRAAARARVNYADTDLALVTAWRGGERAFAGVDLRGTLEVGWWLEAAYVFDDDPHEELAAGVDYSFPVLERAVAFVQYYRNGAGLAEAGEPDFSGFGLECEGVERAPFAPLTRGRDYLLAGGTLVVDTELSATVSWLHNLGDGSGLLVPTVTYQLRDWLDLAATAQVPYALDPDGGELKPHERELRREVAGVPVDLTGLFPAATLTFWTRASF